MLRVRAQAYPVQFKSVMSTYNGTRGVRGTWGWTDALAGCHGEPNHLDARDLRFTALLDTLGMTATEGGSRARCRRDLCAHIALMYPASVVRLTRDDVATAVPRETLIQSARCLLQSYQLIASAELALYESATAETYDHLRARGAGGDQSWSTRLQLLRCEGHWLRGRLALAAASKTKDRGHRLDAATQAIASLTDEKAELASVWAKLLRAGVHAHCGETDAALAVLRDAQHKAAALGLELVAAIACLRQGELLGGDEGLRLVAWSTARLKALDVSMLERIAEVITPGFPSRTQVRLRSPHATNAGYVLPARKPSRRSKRRWRNAVEPGRCQM
jgi:hypothetical protein